MMLFQRLICCTLLLAGALAQEQQAAQPPQHPANPEAVTYKIAGTVVDAVTGQPLADTRVAVAPVTKRDAFKVATTGEDGRFLFEGLARGKYTLTGQRRGYLTQSFNQHEGYSTSIVVGPDLESEGLVFRLPPQGSISGRIADEANEGVRGAQVMLFRVSNDDLTLNRMNMAMSNDEGVYHFAHLTAGKYAIAVQAQPWYAQQLAMSGMGRMRPRTQSGDSGAVVPPEPEKRSPLDVAYPVTYYPGVVDSTSAGYITLAASEKFVADITLHPVPAVRLRVPVENQPPDSHYSVQIKQRVFGDEVMSPSLYARQYSGQDYETGGIAPGRYVVEVIGADKDRNTTTAHEVQLGDNGEEVSSESSALVSVTGTVKMDSRPEPPSKGTNIQFRNRKTKQTVFGQTDEKGEFRLSQNVPRGEYNVFISNAPNTFLRNVAATGARVKGMVVQVTDASPVSLSLTLTQGTGSVEGIALKDGKVFAGAMVILLPDDPLHNNNLVRLDQSDSDGSFTLNFVLPGKYTVLAIEKGWEMNRAQPDAFRPYLAQGVEVQVAPKGKNEIKVNVQ